MPPEVVILLAIGKRSLEGTTLRGTQAPLVEKRFLAKGSCLPAHHSSGRNRDPVNSSGFVGEVTADIRKALASKQLALPGDMELAFETVSFRIVSAFFPEDCPGNPKSRIVIKLGQQKFKVIRVQNHIGIQIANKLVIEVLYYLLAGVEGAYLRSKIPLLTHGQIHKLDPVVLRKKKLDTASCRVCRAIVYDHPFQRRVGLTGYGLDRFFDKRLFVSSRSDQDIPRKGIFGCHCNFLC